MWASVASAALLAVVAPLLLTSSPTLAAAQPVGGDTLAAAQPVGGDVAYVRVCLSEAELRAEATEVGNVMRRALIDEGRITRFIYDVTSGLTANPQLRDDDDDDNDEEEEDGDGDGAQRQTLSVFSAIPGQPGVFCFRQEAAANFIVDRYLASGGREVDEDDLDEDDDLEDDDELEGDDRVAVAPAASAAAAPTAAGWGTRRQRRLRTASAAAAAGVSAVRRVAAALVAVSRSTAAFCRGVCCGLSGFDSSFGAAAICQQRGRCGGRFTCRR